MGRTKREALWARLRAVLALRARLRAVLLKSCSSAHADDELNNFDVPLADVLPAVTREVETLIAEARADERRKHQGPRSTQDGDHFSISLQPEDVDGDK